MTRSTSINHPCPGYIRVEYRIGSQVVWVEYKRDEIREDTDREELPADGG